MLGPFEAHSRLSTAWHATFLDLSCSLVRLCDAARSGRLCTWPSCTRDVSSWFRAAARRTGLANRASQPFSWKNKKNVAVAAYTASLCACDSYRHNCTRIEARSCHAEGQAGLHRPSPPLCRTCVHAANMADGKMGRRSSCTNALLIGLIVSQAGLSDLYFRKL